MSVVHPSLLVAIFSAWAVTCVVAGVGFVRRAPAITLALSGSVFGAVAGFLIGNADGPAEVPAYTGMGASLGVGSCGLIGVLTTSARPPSRPLRHAAVLVLIAAPFTAAALTLLLQLACPLYVFGIDSGFCDYQEQDLLGGWVSGVIVAFLSMRCSSPVCSSSPRGRLLAQRPAVRSSRARRREKRTLSISRQGT